MPTSRDVFARDPYGLIRDTFRIRGRSRVTVSTPDATAATLAIAPDTWIERRLVRRGGRVYGPYRILRWRAGGRLRSRYIGKARDT